MRPHTIDKTLMLQMIVIVSDLAGDADEKDRFLLSQLTTFLDGIANGSIRCYYDHTGGTLE